MIIHIITIFPEMFQPFIRESIIHRAIKKGLVKIHIHNLRDYTPLKHQKVDASPFGGGSGMVLRPEPIFNAVESILGYKIYPKEKEDNSKRIIFFTPKGKVLKQHLLKDYFNWQRLILLSGRYEGIDERVRKYLVEEEVSIGDYILSGGEIAAMVFIDALVRLLPGAVSSPHSIVKESFENNLLDYPHYTRPRNFRGLKVPSLLLSGDHKKIEAWRKKEALKETRLKRPDLFRNYRAGKSKKD